MKINYASFFIGIITGCIVLNLYNFVFNDSSTPLENRSLSGGVSIPSSNENRANPSVTPESMQPSTQPESMQPSTQIVSLKNPVQKIPNPKSQYSLRSIDFLNGFQDWQIKSAVKGLLEIDVNNLKNVTNTKQFTARVMSELMSDVAGGQENDFVSQGVQVGFLSSLNKGDDYYKNTFSKDDTHSVYAAFNTNEDNIIVKFTNVTSGAVLLVKDYDVIPGEPGDKLNYIKMDMPKGLPSGRYSFKLYKADNDLTQLSTSSLNVE